MICEKCRHVNKENAGVCRYCGAPLAVRQAAGTNSASEDMLEDDTEENEDRDIKSRFISVITASCLLVTACIIIFSLTVFPKDTGNLPAAAPNEIPTPVVTKTPSPTPVPTTAPEPTEDLSSIFQRPADTYQ